MRFRNKKSLKKHQRTLWICLFGIAFVLTVANITGLISSQSESIVSDTISPSKHAKDVYHSSQQHTDMIDRMPADLGANDVSSKATEKVLIVSVNIVNNPRLYNYADGVANHKAYAMKHDYDYELLTQSIGRKGASAFMSKAYFLKQLMSDPSNQDYDYFLWIDRDAIFIDCGVSIAQLLDRIDSGRTHSVYVSTEFWAWLNTGVLLFQNNWDSQTFINDWIATYEIRTKHYSSRASILIGADRKVPSAKGKVTYPSDVMKDKEWSCGDQGALIAMLAGFDYRNDEHKWYIDKYDGLGKPHKLHTGDDAWAQTSSQLLLAQRYRGDVKIIGSKWMNLAPGDAHKLGIAVNNAFIVHFNGQPDKEPLIKGYSRLFSTC